MIRNLKRALLLIAAASLLPSTASAATAMTSTPALTVQATVSAKCSVTASTIDFGPLDLTNAIPAAITKSGSISLKCTKSATANFYKLILSSPNLVGTTWNMKNGSDAIPYTIKVNSVDFAAGSPFLFGGNASKNTTITLPVDATIAAGTYDVLAGLYTDTISAQVDF